MRLQPGESVPRSPGDLLLDSSLIVTTNKCVRNIKIVECNGYIQEYFYSEKHITKNENLEKFKDKKNKFDTFSLTRKKEESFIIEQKNIIRSKLQCQRLAKCNMESWYTFITLTISENLKDIKKANKKLRNFIDQVKRVYKNFMYICIPEFQKRGAVHYHLLTNIDVEDTRLIFLQEDNHKFKHVKYWKEGFTKVDPIKNNPKKIVGYISKYMTKDIDDRLFNCHRYFYSRNLKKPREISLDLSNPQDLEYYNNLIAEKKVIYENSYINPYNNEKITFKEYLKK